MTQDKALAFLKFAEKLKCATRHSWTSTGRRKRVCKDAVEKMDREGKKRG